MELNEDKKPEFNVTWKPLTDDCEMPYGAHKGKKMVNVPPDYLLWLKDNDKCSPQVLAYVVDNLQVLEKEAKKQKGGKVKSNEWAIDRPGNARDLRERRVKYNGRKL